MEKNNYTGKRYIVRLGNTRTVKSTDSKEVADAKVEELKELQEVSFRLEDKQEGIMEEYTKQLYQKNYRMIRKPLPAKKK